jgi:hypothetical protein
MPRSHRRRRVREQPIAELRRAARDHIEARAASKGAAVDESEVARVAGELVAFSDPFRFMGRDALIPGERADLREQLIDAWLDGGLPEPEDRLRMALAISATPGSHPRPMRCGIGSNPAPVSERQLVVAFRSQSERRDRSQKRSRAA